MFLSCEIETFPVSNVTLSLILCFGVSLMLSMLLYLGESGDDDLNFVELLTGVEVLGAETITLLSGSDIHIPNFLLNGETLPRVRKYKYLRHIITEDLRDNDDISRQYKRIYTQGNVLIQKFYMCTLFKSILYCMPVVVLG